MKLTIKYQPYNGYIDPLSRDKIQPAYAAAIALAHGVEVCSAQGPSYAQARDRLFAKLQEVLKLGEIPETEVIEATYKSEEFTFK